MFAYLVALGETAVAISLLFGLLSNITNIVGVLLSTVIWTTAEGFGGPYSTISTNVDAAIIYVLVFAGLFLTAAGLFYGVDRYLMFPDESAKLPTRERFLHLVREHYGIKESDVISIPYENGLLPAYRFTPEHPKETLVMFAGFDAYIEEFFAVSFAFLDAGYESSSLRDPGKVGL